MSPCPRCDAKADHTGLRIERGGIVWVAHTCHPCRINWNEPAHDPQAALASFGLQCSPEPTPERDDEPLRLLCATCLIPPQADWMGGEWMMTCPKCARRRGHVTDLEPSPDQRAWLGRVG